LLLICFSKNEPLVHGDRFWREAANQPGRVMLS
jgi:hypothetical protein